MDTAQLSAAETETFDPNAAIENAADAFKAFTSGEPVDRPRDDRGRFAGSEEEEQEIEDEPEGEAESGEETGEDDAAAEDEAQPVAPDMPTSWPKEKAELWTSLPPEAQGYLAERDGEMNRAFGQKAQEVANVRKAAETQLTEANANRERYAELIDTVVSMVVPQKPDPRQYGAGTGNYNREAYDLAQANYDQTIGIVQNLTQQQRELVAQQSQEYERAEQDRFNAVESEWRPKLLQIAPDIQQKAPELVEYAVSQGLPEEIFADPKQASKITSPELMVLWKAMQFDRIEAAKGKVQAKPAPKPATPTARPGVATSRSATRSAQAAKASNRLAKEGSIEAGAAVWKNFL